MTQGNAYRSAWLFSIKLNKRYVKDVDGNNTISYRNIHFSDVGPPVILRISASSSL